MHATAPGPIKYDSMLLNLNFPSSIRSGVADTFRYELIISEAGGRVVLDTLQHFNMPVVGWIKTNAALLDVTVVQYFSTTNNYLVSSYKSIDLSSWQNIPNNDSAQINTPPHTLPPPTPEIVEYTHVNVPGGSYYNTVAGGSGFGTQLWNNVVYANYNVSIGDYAYFLFPDLGLYNLHQIASARDTVDFSVPDTLSTANFNIPSAYNSSGFVLSGYPDTTDISHQVYLTYFAGSGGLIDNASKILYPGKKGFKKYSLVIFASNGSTLNAAISLPWVDTLPNYLPIPSPDWYKISSPNNDSVTVNFQSHQPTYYTISSHIGTVRFSLFAPGDVAELHPVRFYSALKSKLLGNLDYQSIQLDNIRVNSDQQPDYKSYWAERSLIPVVFKYPSSANAYFDMHF